MREVEAKFGIRVCQVGYFDPILLRPGLEVELEQVWVIFQVGHLARDLSMRLHRELAIRQAAQ